MRNLIDKKQISYIILFLISIILILDVDVDTLDFSPPTYEVHDYKVSRGDDVSKETLIKEMLYDISDDFTPVDQLSIQVTNYNQIMPYKTGTKEVKFKVCDLDNNCRDKSGNLIVTNGLN